MMRLTLEIVAKTLFDAEIGGESAEASAAMETLMHGFIARTGQPDCASALVADSAESSASRRAVRRLERIILSDHRRAAPKRRGPGRLALDATASPGRRERPADERPPAPRRGA